MKQTVIEKFPIRNSYKTDQKQEVESSKQREIIVLTLVKLLYD